MRVLNVLIVMALSLIAWMPATSLHGDELEPTAPSLNATAPAEEAAACCGKTLGSWWFERRIDGALIDSGNLGIRPGLVNYLVAPSNAGGYIKLVTLQYPLAEGQKLADLDPAQHLYSGIIPGFSKIIVQQHTPGEEWTFEFGDTRIVKSIAYLPGKYSLNISFNSGGHDVNAWSQGLYGAWKDVEWEDQQHFFLYNPGGCLWEELRPELKEQDWIKLPMPPEMGEMYAIAPPAAEHWIFAVNAKVFEYDAEPAS